MRYIAYYCPRLEKGESDPSKWFKFKDEAQKYIFSIMCSSCKRKRTLFERGKGGEEWPACSCEWEVMTKYRYNKMMENA
jgi:hypothetical protein